MSVTVQLLASPLRGLVDNRPELELPFMTGETVAARRTAIVATAAPVGALGLEVVSVIEAPLVAGTSAWSGVFAAGTLLGVAVLVVLMIWVGFVWPVRRLRQSAAAAASGQVVARSGKPRSAEVRRIAAALDVAGGDVRPRDDRREGRRAVPAAWCVVAATLAVLAWSGGVLVALSRTSPDLPAHVGVDTQNRVVGVATSLSDMLHNGLTQLTQFAGQQAAAGTGARPGPLADLLDEGRFRSVYLLDAGRLVARVGREPLRGATAVPSGSGVHLDESVERVPAVYAYTRLPDGRTLVAEFDVHALISLLRRLDGRALVVDDRMRTILDTEGYIAFHQPAGPVRQAAALALQAPSRAAGAPVDGADGILAYAAVTVPAVTVPAVTVPAAAVPAAAVPAAVVPTAESTLRWAVVSQRRASDHRLAVNDWRTHVWLVVLLGVCLGGLLLGWHHLVLLRPLRVLAAAADRLASGDTKSVVSPSRHDEIGAIAVCLDVCRQARAQGPVRLGGAPRMRGTATDQTVVLPRVLSNVEGP